MHPLYASESEALEDMQHLARVPWPALTQLSLREMDLNLHSLRVLLKQGWPTLVSLKLHCFCLPHVNAMLFPNAQPQTSLFLEAMFKVAQTLKHVNTVKHCKNIQSVKQC